jgi:hypothetical protein
LALARSLLTEAALLADRTGGGFAMSLKSNIFPFLGIPLALATLAGCGGASDIHLNRAPLAAVSGEALRQAHVGNAVVLDASASVDPDGDALRYLWRLETPAGSHARITDGESAVVSFTPDVVGEYRVQLLVSDSEAASVQTLVQVQVTLENTAPVADAGRPRFAPLGALTLLDGSNSHDREGDPLSYHWRMIAPEGSHAVLAGAAMEVAGFLPDRVGVYVVTLVVSDGAMESPSDTIGIVVTEPAQGEDPQAGLEGSATAER